MKIVYLISHLAADGPVNALLSICAGLMETGQDQITILTLSDPKKDTLAPKFVDLGIQVHNVPVGIGRLFSSLAQIRAFLVRGGFDIAASTCIRADGLLAVASTGLRDLKTVTTVQNIPSEDLGFLYPGVRGRIAGWLHYRILKCFGNRIVCCSGMVRDHINARIGANSVCILNPVPAPDITERAEPAVPLVVYAASLSPRKNPAETLSFMVEALPAGTFALDVYGKGPLEQELRERYKDRPEIHWKGFTSSLPLVFARASVYVSSSLSEGFPLTPQLALMCGCPCVLSDIPQHIEMAALSEFVFIYTVGCQESFNRALAKALASNQAQVLSDGRTLMEMVSPRAIAGELRQFYLSL